jgi:penicillin amidase
LALIGRVVKPLLVIVVVVAVAVGGLLFAITTRSLPQTGGTIRIPGLDAEVSIIRDDAGIARIVGSTPHDLFLAQGYVHAQDRLWQMEVWRHISSGRLSELFGESQLETDRLIRALDWRGAAERDLAALSPEARAALDAYAAGVNAFLDDHRGSLGLAFVVTGLQSGNGGPGGYDPEPWTALDSAAWQKVQSWNLGGNMDEEIFRMLADERLGDPSRTDELFPAYPAGAPVITGSGAFASEPAATGAEAATTAPLPGAATVTLDADQATAWREVAGRSTALLAIAGLSGGDALAGDNGIGSNNWVVSPSKSATGGALLANDPHLGLGMPSVWYMNGLHCRTVSEACPFDVVGVSFPGVPAVVLGHNGRIAWGATNVDPDVQDLFVELPDPAKPGRYLYRGESRPFTVRREVIRVAGREPEVLEVRETVHGPILNDVDERLEDAPLLALRWAATSDVDGTFESIFRLNTAANFEEFRAALRGYGTPSQHFVYADVDGHIGYQLPGRIPIRRGGADGLRPAAGDTGASDWRGVVPFEDLPWQLDPASGWIVTANNAPAGPGYPHHLGADWDPGDRAAVILERLGALSADGLTADEMGQIQLDTEVRRARRIIPKLAAAKPTTADGRGLLELIRGWNFGCGAESRACGAYLAFELRLLGAIFDDDLGPLARDYVGGTASWQMLERLLDHPDSTWWDDPRTPSVRETAAAITAAALDRAGRELRELMGERGDWRWGRLHTITFREETLGRSGIGPLEAYFNRGGLPADGAAGAVNNTYYRASRMYPDPYDPEFEPVGLGAVFAVTNGPSYRLTIDMSNLDGARIVQTTGQSGNPFDAHYGDLIEAWRTGKTVPLLFTRAAVEATADARLILAP